MPGSITVRIFAQLGIHLTGSSKADDTTGLCLVLVTPDGERTMKTCLGGIGASVSRRRR